jgi:hypothetical protein
VEVRPENQLMKLLGDVPGPCYAKNPLAEVLIAPAGEGFGAVRPPGTLQDRAVWSFGVVLMGETSKSEREKHPT